jgi:hypothetical protein
MATLSDVNATLKDIGKEQEKTTAALQTVADRIFAQMEAEEKARLRDLNNRSRREGDRNSFGGTSTIGAMGAGLGSGIGDIFKGFGAAGAGIGAFFLGLAGAEAIMGKFGDGENLKNLLTNLAGGLGAFSVPSILALGGLFAAGSLFGGVGKFGGFKGGFGIAAIGFGISAFLVELSAADALIARWGGDGSSLSTFLTNIGNGISSLTGQNMGALGALFAAGGLFGFVKGFGGAFKGGFGIAAIGAGIAAFFTELAVADAIIQKLGSTGEFLGNFTKTISEVIASFGAIDGTVFASLFVAGGVFGAVAGPAAAGKATIGIAAIGAGIAAFFTALAGGDYAIEKMQATGKSLKVLVGNIIDSINLFDGKTAAVIGGLIATGGIFGPAMIGATVGIAAIGTALGLFFAGIGAGDAMITAMSNLTGGQPGEGFKNLLVNTVDGIKKFAELSDMPDLSGLGASLVSLSAGLVAFFATDGIAKLGAAGNEILAQIGGVFDSLFGTDIEGELRKGIIDRLIEGLEPLKTLDPAVITQMDVLGQALDSLVDSFTNLANLNTGNVTDGLASMLKGVATVLAVKKNLIEGGVYDGIGLGNIRDIDFGAGLENFTDEDKEIIENGVRRLRESLGVVTSGGGGLEGNVGNGSSSSSSSASVSDIVNAVTQDVSIVKISDEVLTALTTALMQKDYLERTASSSPSGGVYTDARTTNNVANTSTGIAMDMGSTVDILDGGFAIGRR